MPYVNKPRPYAKEYANYDGTEAVKKKRAERNQNRSFSRNPDHTVKKNAPKRRA